MCETFTKQTSYKDKSELSHSPYRTMKYNEVQWSTMKDKWLCVGNKMFKSNYLIDMLEKNMFITMFISLIWKNIT